MKSHCVMILNSLSNTENIHHKTSKVDQDVKKDGNKILSRRGDSI